MKTFSLGIYEAVPTTTGRGVKRSAVKVRVRGPVSQSAAVYAKATAIATALDEGTYDGPKNVTVRREVEGGYY